MNPSSLLSCNNIYLEIILKYTISKTQVQIII